MGLAASVGLAELPVFKRLKVACFFTGDELAAPGKPLQPGQIYNSNRTTLTGLVNALGCELIDLGIVPDTLEATETALEGAASIADVVITSGGVMEDKSMLGSPSTIHSAKYLPTPPA